MTSLESYWHNVQQGIIPVAIPFSAKEYDASGLAVYAVTPTPHVFEALYSPDVALRMRAFVALMQEGSQVATKQFPQANVIS